MENSNLTVNDLSVVVKIIDACSKRGAFEGNELLVVGQLREKLAAIVASTQASNENEEEKTED